MIFALIYLFRGISIANLFIEMKYEPEKENVSTKS